ncbi:MAG: chloride channel protein, partial [Planctomycetes bacterium]|nr:chloride channel protein [Planctomycetota bacterium]
MTENAPQHAALGERVMRRLRTGRLAKWVLLSGLLGVFAGVVGWLFKLLIHFCRHWSFEAPTGIHTEGLDHVDWGSWWIVLIPAAGGLLVGIITYTLAPEAEGHGTDSVIRAFHRQKGIMRKRIIALKALTSAITIGT